MRPLDRIDSALLGAIAAGLLIAGAARFEMYLNERARSAVVVGGEGRPGLILVGDAHAMPMWVLPSHSPIPERSHDCDDRRQELPHYNPYGLSGQSGCEDGIYFHDSVPADERGLVKRRLVDRVAVIPLSAQQQGCANPTLQISATRRLDEGGSLVLSGGGSNGVMFTSKCGTTWLQSQGYNLCTWEPEGAPTPSPAEADRYCDDRRKQPETIDASGSETIARNSR